MVRRELSMASLFSVRDFFWVAVRGFFVSCPWFVSCLSMVGCELSVGFLSVVGCELTVLSLFFFSVVSLFFVPGLFIYCPWLVVSCPWFLYCLSVVFRPCFLSFQSVLCF